jgi:hypothetical protein
VQTTIILYCKGTLQTRFCKLALLQSKNKTSQAPTCLPWIFFFQSCKIFDEHLPTWMNCEWERERVNCTMLRLPLLFCSYHASCCMQECQELLSGFLLIILISVQCVSVRLLLFLICRLAMWLFLPFHGTGAWYVSTNWLNTWLLSYNEISVYSEITKDQIMYTQNSERFYQMWKCKKIR